jgi:23S rRNA pseudouridine2605 synthase
MNESSSKKRLSKFMAASGVASRRASEELIFAGKVKVNGQIVKVPQTLVNEKDAIEVDGEVIGHAESKVYYILNKPIGYICTNLRTNSTKIVLDLFPDVKERLFTIGRLDKDTQGLIILTNDGHFANMVIHPSKNIHKEYLVKTENEITHDHLIAISNGTLVEGTFVKPIRVTKVRKGTLKIVISEGKKREVRMMMESAGLQVKELTRIRIGGLSLGELETGSWRAMTEKEKELIFN